MPRREIVGIDVCCSVTNVLFVGIDVNLVSWVAGMLDMLLYKWLQVPCVWLRCRWSLACLLPWTFLEIMMISLIMFCIHMLVAATEVRVEEPC